MNFWCLVLLYAMADTPQQLKGLETQLQQLSLQNSDLEQQHQQQFEAIVKKIHNQDPNIRREGVRELRKSLSETSTTKPHLDNVIKSGLLPDLVAFLGEDSDHDLQFEAGWALTNVASGEAEQTEAVMNAGAIPPFVKLLTSRNIMVREQAMWGLGNLCGSGRDMILHVGGLKPLLHCLINTTNLTVLRTGTWCLSNLVRGKPSPCFEEIVPCVPVLGVLLNVPDDEILVNICWGISYFTDGTNNRIESVVQHEFIILRLVELLEHENEAISLPALRAIGNIVSGEEAHTQAVLNNPFALPILKKLLLKEGEQVVKEVCFAVSNITAGTPRQVQMVIDYGLIPSVIGVMKNEEYSDITVREASYVLSNVVNERNPEQTIFLIEQEEVVPLFLSFLLSSDVPTVLSCLEGLESILKFGTNTNRFGTANPFIALIQSCEDFQHLTDLLNHENTEILELASSLVKTYFGEKE